MNIFNRIIYSILPVFSILLLTASPASAGKKPEDIRLTPDSKEGAILIRVESIPAPYRLIFTKSGNSGFGSRAYAVLVDAGRGEDVYAARSFQPGRYRLDAIVQQKKWGLGFKNTIEVEIESGKISYLGSLNARDLLLDLQRQAISAGKGAVQMGGGFNATPHYSAPTFSGRDNAGLEEATSFANRVMLAKPEMVKLGELVEVRGPVD